jgi:hypothetical protein
MVQAGAVIFLTESQELLFADLMLEIFYLCGIGFSVRVVFTQLLCSVSRSLLTSPYCLWNREGWSL